MPRKPSTETLGAFVRRQDAATLADILIDLPAVGEKRVGTASGLYFSFAEVGGVAGPLTLGLLYDLTGGFTVGLFTLAGFAGIILLSVLALVPYVGRAASQRRS